MLSNFKLLFLAVLSLALFSAASGQGQITDVSVRQISAGSAVHIGGKDLPKPFTKWENSALVLKFKGNLLAKSRTIHPKAGAIVGFSFRQEGPFVSVAVRPRLAGEPQILKAEDGWLVSFHAKASSGAPAKSSQPIKSTSPFERSSATITRASQLVASKTPAKTPGISSDPVANIDNVICSLQVSDMDPAKILQTLSAQTHANIVLLSKPDLRLTIRLSHVPLFEMISHICAMCDLAFVRVGKAYIIATPERLKAGYPKEWEALHPVVPIVVPPIVEMATETYDTSFVTGEEIVKALEKIFAGKNLVFIAGPNPMSPEIGIQDSSKATGTSTTVLSKGTTTDASARMIVITGEKLLVASALAMAKHLDKARRQVSIAVTIHDITNDALSDIGITWNFGNMTVTESKSNGLNFGSFGRTPFSISTTLNALIKNGKSKLLACPNVSVLDGERAFVLIGDRISYPVLIGYSQSNAPIFSKEEERVGIYLQVSASIGQDGSVTLSLYPQVSTISGYLTINGASYPQISTREAQTTLRVASGETIVMGGLFSDEEIASVEKVPFLSQIPILGAIFQHRKVTKSKSQVIITVTPTVIVEGPR